MLAVAYSLHGIIRSLDGLMSGPPWAMSAELHGQGNEATQRVLLTPGTRYIALFFLPTIVIVAVFAGPLIPTGWGWASRRR